ncbi:hypothetical protein [Microvirga rosea]|uniref:hypothetical protein n=1 Tax=Microvirga rosea TaxID=2715425 RepID=UPI001D09FAA0|nr:hypothetical protein [Microvirga rosea]MCB8823479.1 hypothetical protein [Microvirga rosea]
MMSSLADIGLFLALVVTSICVISMYIKLTRLQAYNVEYKHVLSQTTEALNAASLAMQTVNADGKETLTKLNESIKEARSLILDLQMMNQQRVGDERSPISSDAG